MAPVGEEEEEEDVVAEVADITMDIMVHKIEEMVAVVEAEVVGAHILTKVIGLLISPSACGIK